MAANPAIGQQAALRALWRSVQRQALQAVVAQSMVTTSVAGTEYAGLPQYGIENLLKY